MIAKLGLPLDYVRHFAPQPAAGQRCSQGGRSRSAYPEPTCRNTSGMGSDPAEGPAVPDPGEPSEDGKGAPSPIPAMCWHRSSYTADPNDGLEYAALPGGGAAIRHSRQPDVVLEYTRGEWDAFVGGARDGEFAPAAQAPTQQRQPSSDASHEPGTPLR